MQAAIIITSVYLGMLPFALILADYVYDDVPENYEQRQLVVMFWPLVLLALWISLVCTLIQLGRTKEQEQ